MKIVIVIIGLLGLSGCSTIKMGLESLPYYEETPETVRVGQAYQHALTAAQYTI